MNKTVIVISIAAVALKAFLTFGVVQRWGLNWDENSAWTVAQHHVDGHGYTLYNEASGQYEPTAFHGAFTVLLYEQLIRQGISRASWAVCMHIISLLLFVASVWYFYRLAAVFIREEKWRIGATLSYAFYPSVQYYIGSMLLYENFTGSLLVIVACYLLRPATEKFPRAGYVLLPLLIAVSCWFRPQLLVIYTVVLSLCLAFAVDRKRVFVISTLALLLLLPGCLAVLQKNQRLFGASTLSTQGGFELLQGHYPHARGSWLHHWDEPGNPLYEYAHAHIPGIDTLNEFEASQARKKLAIDWAFKHPVDEVALSIRKASIYFLPDNFEELEAVPLLDAVTGIVHLLFLLATVWLTWKRKWNRQILALYFPVAASLLLTIVFYFGCRWRFYAEPFMILVAWVFVNERIKECGNLKM